MMSNFKDEPGSYDTSINVIGGLKDMNYIFKAFDSYFSSNDSFNDLIKERNELNLRTQKSRIRIERGIRLGFLQFKGHEHKDLIQCIFKKNTSPQDKELILFWQFALNNRLFREISIRVFSRVYFSGRTSLSKDDIKAYLKDFLSEGGKPGISWSESTINTLSTKYLNLMTKLNFLTSGKIRNFKHIKPSSEAQILFLYFAKLNQPDVNDILKNEMLPLLFIPKEDIQKRLKKLSNKGYFNMEFNGVNLNIQLTQSYKGICDVIYN